MSRIGIIGTRALSCLAVGFAPTALGQTNNGCIGIYADAVGTQPCTTVDQFATLYVIAIVEGASASGFTGAEFRIEVESRIRNGSTQPMAAVGQAGAGSDLP